MTTEIYCLGHEYLDGDNYPATRVFGDWTFDRGAVEAEVERSNRLYSDPRFPEERYVVCSTEVGGEHPHTALLREAAEVLRSHWSTPVDGEDFNNEDAIEMTEKIEAALL